MAPEISVMCQAPAWNRPPTGSDSAKKQGSNAHGRVLITLGGEGTGHIIAPVMYVPDHFREDRPEVLHDAMRRIGFATLVTQKGWRPTICPCCCRTACCAAMSPAPIRCGSRATGAALAIFLGPHAYVSPNWYPSKAETGKAVPTWNYITVHARGPIRWIQDAGLAARPCHRAEPGA